GGVTGGSPLAAGRTRAGSLRAESKFSEGGDTEESIISRTTHQRFFTKSFSASQGTKSDVQALIRVSNAISGGPRLQDGNPELYLYYNAPHAGTIRGPARFQWNALADCSHAPGSQGQALFGPHGRGESRHLEHLRHAAFDFDRRIGFRTSGSVHPRSGFG